MAAARALALAAVRRRLAPAPPSIHAMRAPPAARAPPTPTSAPPLHLQGAAATPLGGRPGPLAAALLGPRATLAAPLPDLDPRAQEEQARLLLGGRVRRLPRLPPAVAPPLGLLRFSTEATDDAVHGDKPKHDASNSGHDDNTQHAGGEIHKGDDHGNSNRSSREVPSGSTSRDPIHGEGDKAKSVHGEVRANIVVVPTRMPGANDDGTQPVHGEVPGGSTTRKPVDGEVPACTTRKPIDGDAELHANSVPDHDDQADGVSHIAYHGKDASINCANNGKDAAINCANDAPNTCSDPEGKSALDAESAAINSDAAVPGDDATDAPLTLTEAVVPLDSSNGGNTGKIVYDHTSPPAGEVLGKDEELLSTGEVLGKDEKTHSAGEVLVKDEETHTAGEVLGKDEELLSAGEVLGKDEKTHSAGEVLGKDEETHSAGEVHCKDEKTHATGEVHCKDEKLHATGEVHGKDEELHATGEGRQCRCDCAEKVKNMLREHREEQMKYWAYNSNSRMTHTILSAFINLLSLGLVAMVAVIYGVSYAIEKAHDKMVELSKSEKTKLIVANVLNWVLVYFNEVRAKFINQGVEKVSNGVATIGRGVASVSRSVASIGRGVGHVASVAWDTVAIWRRMGRREEKDKEKDE